MARKKSGWFGESRRHSLASKGVETGRKQTPRHPRVRRLKPGQKVVSTYEYDRIQEKRAEKTPEQELWDLKKMVKEEVREAIDNYIEENPDMDRDTVEGNINDNGTIDEITDSSVPVYTSDIMELGSLGEVYGHENELPPAFDGTPTPSNIVATSIYEILNEEAWEEVHDYLDKLEEDGRFKGSE